MTKIKEIFKAHKKLIVIILSIIVIFIIGLLFVLSVIGNKKNNNSFDIREEYLNPKTVSIPLNSEDFYR